MITLRQVEDRDALPFYRWWTDMETTRLFRKPNSSLTWEEHIRWFTANFGNPWWLVGEANGRAVGAVRVDDGWISIVMAPESRSQGHGQELLRLVSANYCATRGQLKARIHQLNAPSLRAFQRAGYLEVDTDGPWRIYACG